MRTLLGLSLLFPVAILAGNYSGTVRLTDNTPAVGVRVSLSGTSLADTTDTQGRWSLSAAVGISHRARDVVSTSPMEIGFGPHYRNRSVAGRAVAGKVSAAGSFSVAARNLASAWDTLVYESNGKVFLRDTVWGSSVGVVRYLDTTWNPSIVYGYQLDERDNQTYRTVRIGFTTWLAQNLNYAGASGDTGLCYLRDTANCAKWGRIYLWDVAMAGSVKNGARGICPVGWHVPTQVEWNDLQDVARLGGKKSGPQLRATSGWASGGGATDALGFRALPGGGWYQLKNSFGDAGNFGTWFTSTSPEFFITQISLGWKEDSLWQIQQSFASGSSLRCTKN